jgi:spore maturation protein CgeB
MSYNTNDLGRLTFYGRARMPDDMTPCEHGHVPTHQAVTEGSEIIRMAVDGLYRECFLFWPEVLFFVSGFYMTPELLQVMRTRRIKIVILHTESPYQDEEQMARGELADLNLLNDPVNLEAWKDLDVPVAYMPHAYDPDIHFPDWRASRFETDFLFVGTLFRSRAEFFSRIDFSGLTASFGGSGWDLAMAEYPEVVTRVVDQQLNYRLVDYLSHALDCCVPNEETARLYRTARAGINFYRRESEENQTGKGWAMGPREVEMAASGLFFLRDPRPEGDELFDGVLPTFSSAEEASALLHLWVKDPRMRERAAQLAYERVAARTFDNNARRAQTLMEEAGIL